MLLHYSKIGFKWRGGATITFLEPIEVSADTALSAAEITGLVRSAIFAEPCRTYSGQLVK